MASGKMTLCMFIAERPHLYIANFLNNGVDLCAH